MQILKTSLSHLCFCLSVCLIVIFEVTRIGFADSLITEDLKILGVSGYLLFFPDLFAAKTRAVATFLVILIPAVFIPLLPEPPVAVHIIAWTLTWGITVYGLFKQRITAPIFPSLKWFLLSVFLVALAFAASGWGNSALSPLFLEKIKLGALNGTARYAHPDPLFHTSIANMIRTYGVPSTGLNGVPILNYHIGSHWLFAGLSGLVGVSAFHIYQIGFVVIFVPLFLKTVFLAAEKTRDKIFSPLNIAVILSLWFFLVDEEHFLRISYLGSCFVSESFTVSLLFALLLMTYVMEHRRFLTGPEALKNLGAIQTFSKAMILLLMIAAISVTKISTGFVMVALAGYLWLRLKFYRSIGATLFMVVTGILFLFLQKSFTNFQANSSQFELLAMHKTAPHPLVLFYLTHFGFSLLYLCIRMSQIAWKKDSLASFKALDVECVIVLFLIVLFPALTTDLHGDWPYFTQISHWLVLPFAIAFADSIPSHFGSFKIPNYRGWITPRNLLGALAVFGFFTSIQKYLHTMDVDRKHLASAHVSPLPNEKIIDDLLAIEDLIPKPEKSITLVYVPKGNRLFWDALPLCKSFFEKSTVQFFGPSLTGMAMLDGLPEKICTPFSFGLSSYDFSQTIGMRTITDVELCERVKALEFQQLIVLDEKEARVIRCTH